MLFRWAGAAVGTDKDSELPKEAGLLVPFVAAVEGDDGGSGERVK